MLKSFGTMSYKKIGSFFVASLPGHTWDAGLKIWKKIQNSNFFILFASCVKNGTSHVLEVRFLVFRSDKRMNTIDANSLEDPGMLQREPFIETNFENNASMEEIISTSDNADIGFAS